jgi:hypothetical protein
LYHTNRGQLAFALKDKANPTEEDLRTAEALLTRAIAIRQRRQDNGWLSYEFNRAYCRIRLDSAFLMQQASPPELRSGIVADLRAAAGDEDFRNVIRTEAPFVDWMRLNQVSEADIGIG